jgi:GTP cyclohydrolase II
MRNKLGVPLLSSSSQHLKSVINGKALIFCESSKKHKKRDAIDTDQIIPSSYCSSDSVDIIDENRKIGAFKYLVPNFRERVHQGENFLIMGKRVGIGSSLEMSLAGIKGIGLEANKEIVIVCGDDLGKIFRQNAINLGIYIFHSCNAVEEAEDDDEFQFNFATDELINITKKKKYHPPKMNEKEKELLSLEGIFALGGKELLEDHHKSDFMGCTPIHDLKNSNDRVKFIYSQPKKYNTISAISVPHHIETNMGRWIHVAVAQNEKVYDPSNLNGKKITMTKEHSIYIYNPSLDKVVDLSKISLDQLIPHRKQPVLMRIHSLCRFGDSFGSLMCDCGPQLIAAKRAIISNGSGMIIYLEQEGRNAGLTAKAAAYRLDAVEKIPTDKAFNELGLDRSDLRDYHVVLDIFSVFKINKAELMTNNPKKFALLTSAGKEIIQRPISIPATEHNLHYLMTKKNHMGHELLTFDKKSSNENHIKVANTLNEIHQVINEKNMSIFQKIVDEEKEKKQ